MRMVRRHEIWVFVCSHGQVHEVRGVLSVLSAPRIGIFCSMHTHTFSYLSHPLPSHPTNIPPVSAAVPECQHEYTCIHTRSDQCRTPLPSLPPLPPLPLLRHVKPRVSQVRPDIIHRKSNKPPSKNRVQAKRKPRPKEILSPQFSPLKPSPRQRAGVS